MPRTSLTASLRARGFDRSFATMELGARACCSQCEALVINGIACHEHDDAKAYDAAVKIAEEDEDTFNG
jgi:hypothetical protein